MVRFAHVADVHLGAFREPRLRQENLSAFLKAMDLCLAGKVDFVLLCGDLFHTSLPDMAVVKEAAGKLRELVDAGIPVHVIYGSHDFSAGETSIGDVLSSAGVLDKISRAEVDDEGAVVLEGTVDERTGTVLAGLSGRKLGLDRSYYERLDASRVLALPGPKVFAFHGAIAELKPRELAEMEAMPASLLPEGFDYYAGGHVHERVSADIPGRGPIAYPGPLFGDGYRDLESPAPRGFYIVTIEGGGAGGPPRRPRLDFIELPARRTLIIEVDAGQRAPEDVNRELRRRAEEAPAGDATVLVRVRGELSKGRTSDVDTEAARRKLAGAGAFTVYVNRGGLSTRERARVRVEAEGGREGLELRLLRESLAGHPCKLPELKGEEGLLRARRLLEALRVEQVAGTRADQELRILATVERVLFGDPSDGGAGAGAAGPGPPEGPSPAMPPHGAERGAAGALDAPRRPRGRPRKSGRQARLE